QAEDRERRKAAGESPQGQLLLARWCRKNNLNGEAQFHWASVLTVDPKNEEALRALNLRWQKGQLVSREQIAQQKDQTKEAKLPAQAATESLGRHAVFAPGDSARSAAIEKLKKRDIQDFVPMLLAGLGMPIESSFSINTGADGSVHYIHSMYREGPVCDWSVD